MHEPGAEGLGYPREGLDTGPLPGQLAFALDLDAFDDAPQLSLWKRLGVARDLLKGGDFDRDTKCNRTRFRADADAEIHRFDSGSWSMSGVIKCGTWTCPSCGPARSRDTSSKLAVAFRKHLAASIDHDIAMMSLTIPHYADDKPEDVVRWLYAACADFYRSRAWRRFAKRIGLVGRVRVLDATHGDANGSHPHFHVALFLTRATVRTVDLPASPREWVWREGDGPSTDEATEVYRALGLPMTGQLVNAAWEGMAPWQSVRAACSEKQRKQWYRDLEPELVPAWEAAVRASGARIKNPTRFRETALRISPSEKAASYFLKWGLADEIGAPTAKARNHLRLLDAVDAQVKGAAYAFKQWRRAVDGVTWVTGLADACRRLGVTDDDAHAYLVELRAKREAELAAAGTPVVKVRPLRLVLRSHVYAASLCAEYAIEVDGKTVHLRGPEAVFAFCNEADAKEGADVQRELDDFLWRSLVLVRSRDTS